MTITESLPETLDCQFPDCDEDGVIFEITTSLPFDPAYVDSPDTTTACTEHVGAMLGNLPDKPEATRWVVRLAQEATE